MEWIKTKDKLPEINKMVLIKDRFLDIPIVARLASDNCWYSNKDHLYIDGHGRIRDEIESCNVTHWMSFPELPKE